MRRLLLTLTILAAGCGEAPKPAAEAPPRKQAPAPPDQSRWFPKKDQISMTLVPDHVLNKDFLPGGNVGKYKRGPKEYEMFLVKAADNQAAALLTFDYKKALDGAKLIPHFGGYFGKDAGRDTFVFAKNAWLVGIAGLNEKEADAVARDFAARLQ